MLISEMKNRQNSVVTFSGIFASKISLCSPASVSKS